MSNQSKLEKVQNALTGVNGLTVYHYWRYSVNPPYCIWQEDSSTGIQTDNHKGEMGLSGSIHYFTLTEYDANVDNIQNALNGVENLFWALNSVQYEDDTNLIHHEWRFTILG